MAIALLATLAGLALPLFTATLQTRRLDAAARKVRSDIRAAQSLAVTRGGVFGYHWGGDPFVGGPPGQYRIERDATGACGWPLPADTTASNQNVITDWLDLSGEFPGITVSSVTDSNGNIVGGVMFNSRGASVNTCTAVTFPLTVTVSDASGATRTIEVQRVGRVRIQ